MAAKTAQKGDTVLVEYTGTLETGETFDRSKGKDPLKFEIGTSQVIKGFETGVTGMKVGEEKNVKIKPSEGYGERNEKLVREIPRKTNKITATSIKINANPTISSCAFLFVIFCFLFFYMEVYPS